jgi:hypothetical protein
MSHIVPHPTEKNVVLKKNNIVDDHEEMSPPVIPVSQQMH